MSAEGAASTAAEPAGDAPSPQREARRTGVHIALIALGIVLFAATYAGAQYLLARHAVVGFMKDRWNADITDVHIEEFSLTDQWSIAAVWAFKIGDEDNALTTETSWLGLGRTRVPTYPGFRSGSGP